MKNKNIIDSWNKVKPDSLAQERMLNKIISRSDKRKIVMYWKPITVVVAACLVLIGGVFFSNNNQINTKSNMPPVGEQTDLSYRSNEIKGLKVNKFKLSEFQSNMLADRLVFFNFADFFEQRSHSFVIVKVEKTRLIQGKGYDNSGKQIATVKTLKIVTGDTIPTTLPLTQNLYGGCVGDEVTNLLRKGGVYLLPIVKYKDEYYLSGDLDVLFEIDNRGKIWSHSQYSDFNRYDGEDYIAVVNHIKSMTEDDDLMLASSPFGMALREWQLLEVTVTDEPKEEKVQSGGTEIIYPAQVVRALSGEMPGGDFLINAGKNEEISLKKGERYLLFVDNYAGKHYMKTTMIASVNQYDKIKDLGIEGSIWKDYNGYKVDKISELTLKVLTFLKTYEK